MIIRLIGKSGEPVFINANRIVCFESTPSAPGCTNVHCQGVTVQVEGDPVSINAEIKSQTGADQ